MITRTTPRYTAMLVCVFLTGYISATNADIVTNFDALVPAGTTPNFFDFPAGGTNQFFSFTSTLAIEIGGTDEALYDQYRDIDTLTVDGATLVLNIVAPSDAEGAAFDAATSFCPAPGDSFKIFDAQTIIVNQPFVLQLDPRVQSQLGLSWDTSQLYTTGTINVVPEPSPTLVLLLLAGLFAIKRRFSAG